MFTLYTLFKFLHVIGAIIWIGGVITLSIINARAARETDRTVLAVVTKQSSFLGRTLIGPAAAGTLIAGIVTAASGGMSFGVLWITWGFVGIFGSMALGAIFINRVTGKLNELARTAEPSDSRLATLQQRLAALNILNILLLLSVVWAMVFKPTL